MGQSPQRLILIGAHSREQGTGRESKGQEGTLDGFPRYTDRGKPFALKDMPSDQKRLESWKEIAAYLNREVRTARRWEKERGLPVYRMPGKRSGVYALAPEIDAWLKTRAPNGSGGDGAVEAPPLPPRSWARKLTPWVAAASVLLLAIAALSALTGARSAVPRLSHPVTITNDGWIKAGPMGGGRSLFFITMGAHPRTLRRIGESGGEASIIPFPSQGFIPLDVSRDGS